MVSSGALEGLGLVMYVSHFVSMMVHHNIISDGSPYISHIFALLHS